MTVKVSVWLELCTSPVVRMILAERVACLVVPCRVVGESQVYRGLSYWSSCRLISLILAASFFGSRAALHTSGAAFVGFWSTYTACRKFSTAACGVFCPIPSWLRVRKYAAVTPPPPNSTTSTTTIEVTSSQRRFFGGAGWKGGYGTGKPGGVQAGGAGSGTAPGGVCHGLPE